jgi:LmbE family N-acetylglucosaminyl deacetylase
MLARERSPDIQIVVMTAHQRADYAVAALRARVDEFLFKPFDRDTLVTLTQRLAAERRERNLRQRRVLAIGSHPDDVEIGCGGSLRAHVLRGDVVHILTLTGGEAGGAVSTRMAESKAAAAILGAKLTIANLVDTNISEGAETITVIESAIAKFRPTVIYTHSVHDGHQDHRNVARATAVAARRVPSLLCYQAPSTTIAFAPTRFTDVTQTLRDKQAAIQAFQSQAGRPYMTPEMIEATARYWGRFAGYGLCEPFEVGRELAQ